MKIGVLSDIHGNHYALQEVLKAARTEMVDRLLILGDFVGYYYHPEKVLEMLSAWDCLTIKGNHEIILLEVLSNITPESEVRKKYGSGHRLAIEKLSKEQIQSLTDAPEKRRVEIDNVSLLMCHGSPVDANLYLYPDTEKQTLDSC